MSLKESHDLETWALIPVGHGWWGLGDSCHSGGQVWAQSDHFVYIGDLPGVQVPDPCWRATDLISAKVPPLLF